MTEPRRYGWHSLRFKLVVASVVVEALMLSVLVWNSARITGNATQEIFQDHVATLVPLLHVSLANPLAQRDYATLDERLRRTVNEESLAYVEVRDELGQVVASRGKVPKTAQLDTSFEVPDHVYDQTLDITLAGQLIGRARYGLDVRALERTVASLRNQGILVAAAGIVLSVLLLATLGALLTRRLLTLAQAAHTLQGGDYSTRVPVVGRDEVTDTARAFNAMADALARDIGERQQAEQVLHDSEERFRATFEQAAVGIAQVAPDGRWLHVNRKLCDIVGYSREELLQRSFQDITHPDDLDADLAFVRRMLAGEIQTYGMEKRYLRKDGSLIWIYLTVGLVRQPTGEPKYFISVVEDITERKRAEAALQESQRTLATLISNLPGVVYRCRNDKDWTTEFASDGMLALLGVPASDFLAGKVQVGQFIHPDDREPVWNAIQTALKEQRPYTLTYRLRTASGQEKWVWEQGQGIYASSGELLYLEGFVTDISDRKRAEAALQQSEQRLRDLIDGLGPQMFVGLLTLDGIILEANRPALAAAGLKPEDVLGKPVEETYWWSYSEEVKRQLRAAVVRAARGEASRYDVRIRVAENQFIILDFSLQPLRDAAGRIAFLIPSAMVITERKQAEAALHESEERLRLALDAAHMGTFDWDIPANRIAWSHWHEELWGFKPGEFGGTYEAFAARVHPEDLPGINAEVEGCIAARAPFAREFRVVWPDGGIHWIAARGEFTFGAGGQPLRMRGAVMEITERKRTELQLAENTERLELMSRQLLVAQETERRNIARELHDEIGQLLTVVKLDLQRLLRLRATAELAAALKDGMQSIDRVVSKVRDLSLDLRPSMLDDLGLAPTLRWYVQRQAKRLGVEIRLSLPPAPPALSADVETACFRIVQEALTNAARHAGAGHIEVTLAPTANGVELAVRDDGRGFDVGAARAKSLAGGGAGLLGMTERAELAGGRLSVESTSGRGATVRAQFPKTQKQGTGT